ncbi:p-type ATPase [Babesia caballi]|uniref:P-type ATPase n=1 Tax=Babesia caballi TaxID=5871 RepID=A0AAV4LU28_BABCB|nr:p-type ATPase [Babesia caballi]
MYNGAKSALLLLWLVSALGAERAGGSLARKDGVGAPDSTAGRAEDGVNYDVHALYLRKRRHKIQPLAAAAVRSGGEGGQVGGFGAAAALKSQQIEQKDDVTGSEEAEPPRNPDQGDENEPPSEDEPPKNGGSPPPPSRWCKSDAVLLSTGELAAFNAVALLSFLLLAVWQAGHDMHAGVYGRMPGGGRDADLQRDVHPAGGGHRALGKAREAVLRGVGHRVLLAADVLHPAQHLRRQVHVHGPGAAGRVRARAHHRQLAHVQPGGAGRAARDGGVVLQHGGVGQARAQHTRQRAECDVRQVQGRVGARVRRRGSARERAVLPLPVRPVHVQPRGRRLRGRLGQGHQLPAEHQPDRSAGQGRADGGGIVPANAGRWEEHDRGPVGLLFHAALPGGGRPRLLPAALPHAEERVLEELHHGADMGVHGDVHHSQEGPHHQRPAAGPAQAGHRRLERHRHGDERKHDQDGARVGAGSGRNCADRVQLGGPQRHGDAAGGRHRGRELHHGGVASAAQDEAERGQVRLLAAQVRHAAADGLHPDERVRAGVLLVPGAVPGVEHDLHLLLPGDAVAGGAGVGEHHDLHRAEPRLRAPRAGRLHLLHRAVADRDLRQAAGHVLRQDGDADEQRLVVRRAHGGVRAPRGRGDAVAGGGGAHPQLHQEHRAAGVAEGRGDEAPDTGAGDGDVPLAVPAGRREREPGKPGGQVVSWTLLYGIRLCRMFHATGCTVEQFIDSDGNTRRYIRCPTNRDLLLEVVRTFDFHYQKKLSSVVVSVKSASADKTVTLAFVKGAYESVAACSTGSFAALEALAKQQAEAGSYVLGLGYRLLAEDENVSKREAAESKLTMGGLLVFNNSVRAESAGVIAKLHEAKVRPVILTGDNVPASQFVAKSVGMFSEGGAAGPNAELVDGELVWHFPQSPVDEESLYFGGHCENLALTGDAFDYIEEDWENILRTYGRFRANKTANEELFEQFLLRVRIFARLNPHQKVRVINSFKRLGIITGMCGDGTNDCLALQASHAGVSLTSVADVEPAGAAIVEFGGTDVRHQRGLPFAALQALRVHRDAGQPGVQPKGKHRELVDTDGQLRGAHGVPVAVLPGGQRGDLAGHQLRADVLALLRAVEIHVPVPHQLHGRGVPQDRVPRAPGAHDQRQRAALQRPGRPQRVVHAVQGALPGAQRRQRRPQRADLQVPAGQRVPQGDELGHRAQVQRRPHHRVDTPAPKQGTSLMQLIALAGAAQLALLAGVSSFVLPRATRGGLRPARGCSDTAGRAPGGQEGQLAFSVGGDARRLTAVAGARADCRRESGQPRRAGGACFQPENRHHAAEYPAGAPGTPSALRCRSVGSRWLQRLRCRGTGMRVGMVDEIETQEMPDVVIGTPLKLLDKFHLYNLNFKVDVFKNIAFLVLDEADQLVEQSSEDKLREFLALAKRRVKTVLAAATVSTAGRRSTENRIGRLFRPVKVVRSKSVHALPSHIECEFVYCADYDRKVEALLELLRQVGPGQRALVFCGSAESSQRLAARVKALEPRMDLGLISRGVEVAAQLAVLDADRGSRFTVCTNAIARGVDLPGVSLVVQFDFPTNILDHIHRAGRAGRGMQPCRTVLLWTDENREYYELLSEHRADLAALFSRKRGLRRKLKRGLSVGRSAPELLRPTTDDTV